MTRRVEPLSEHDVRGFRSGVHPLDDYLCRHARGNDARGLGRAWVLLRGVNDPQSWPDVIGYFTLSMAQLPAEVTRRVTGEQVPGYPTPVALIGRLARDERARGGRVGDTLIGEALRSVLTASSLVACFGVVADAKDEHALHFYETHSFVAIADGPYPRRCFLALSTAQNAMVAR